MKVNFELLAEPECGIAIDSSSTEYVTDEASLRIKGNFSKEYSVILNILCKDTSTSVQIQDDETELDCDFIDHSDPTEVTHHKFSQGDGIYRIHHFVIPTEAWVTDIYFDSENPYTGSYNVLVYYSDGKLYKSILLQDTDDEESTLISEEITYQDLLDMVDEQVNASFLYETTTTLCLCGLHECYFHLAMDLLNQKGVCNTDTKQDLIYKRDMVWMGINVINYLLDEGYELEAAAILEKLEGCNGVCSKNLGHKPFVNCGCHK